MLKVDIYDKVRDKEGCLLLRQDGSGYTWHDENAELAIDPQPTISRAKRALDKFLGDSFDIFWESADKPLKENKDMPVSMKLPPSLVWELKLVAAIRGETFSTFCAKILSHYMRPGSLPPLDEKSLQELLLNQGKKHPKR